jgi:hypothetical protein
MCHPFMKGLYHKINVICVLKIYLWPISIRELNTLDSSFFEINIHDCINCISCHDLSIEFAIKENASKGASRKCNLGVTFTLGMWRNEPTHSQVDSHFGSWNPYVVLDFQRGILGVKTRWIKKFLISWESY